jgi:hypothetical protein
LANQVEQFVKDLPGVRTEKEQIAAGMLAQVEAQRRRGAARDSGQARDGGEAPHQRGG